MDNSTLIQCKQLSVNRGKRPVLTDINLSVHAGEITTIVGPNGSGKTSLCKTLIGGLQPTSGTLYKKDNLRFGYVPQRLFIDETLPLTVRRFMNLPGGFTATAVEQALHWAGIPHLDKQQIMALSGGEFQRVLLARALLGNPNVLLLDEATQGLDHQSSATFYRQIASVRKQLGCAIIMISHELHVVMRQTDWVICLNGHICCQGKPEKVSQMPEYLALFGLNDHSEAAVYLHRHPPQSPLSAHTSHVE